MIILQMASEKKNVNLARTSRRRGSGGWLFPKRGTFGIPRGLRRPPRRADAPLSSGTFLIQLRDAGEEFPPPRQKTGAPGEIRTGSRPRFPCGLRRPPRRADAPFSSGTFLISPG